MQYIPPFLSQIIDSLAFQTEPTEFREDWLAWRADFQDYYENERDYTLSVEDAQVMESLPSLLEELEQTVEASFAGAGDADTLMKRAQDFFEAHDTFFEEREKQYFVPNPALDRLLKVAVAHRQERCSAEAVLKRAPDAGLAVNAIHELYQSVRDELPEELDRGTVHGFQSAQRGLELLSDCGENRSHELLEEAIAELKTAGELLQHLPRLFERFEEEAGSAIPILGSALNLLREDDSEETLLSFHEQAWPAFLELWASRGDAWMLEPELAYELLGTADQDIAILAELSESFPEQEDEFWDTVEHLEETFEQIRENTMNFEELPASPYWPEAQLLLNLLRGGAPIYAAHTLAKGILESGEDTPSVIKSLGEHLVAFVREPAPLPLLQALKELQEDFHLSKTSRPCTQCGHRMPLQAKSCESCGHQVEELSVSG